MIPYLCSILYWALDCVIFPHTMLPGFERTIVRTQTRSTILLAPSFREWSGQRVRLRMRCLGNDWEQHFSIGWLFSWWLEGGGSTIIVGTYRMRIEEGRLRRFVLVLSSFHSSQWLAISRRFKDESLQWGPQSRSTTCMADQVSLKEGGSFRCLNHRSVNKRNSNMTNWLVQMHSAWTNRLSTSSCISNSAHLMLSTWLRALWSHTIFTNLCFSSLWPSLHCSPASNVSARMERPYTQADIKYALLFFSPFLPEWSFDTWHNRGLTRGQLAAHVALQKDCYQGLNRKCFNCSKTKLEHLVNEILHPNSRFTTMAPLPSLPVPGGGNPAPQLGAVPESPLTLLTSSPPPLPAAAVQVQGLPKTVAALQVPESFQGPTTQPHDILDIANGRKAELYSSMLQFDMSRCHSSSKGSTSHICFRNQTIQTYFLLCMWMSTRTQLSFLISYQK